MIVKVPLHFFIKSLLNNVQNTMRHALCIMHRAPRTMHFAATYHAPRNVDHAPCSMHRTSCIVHHPPCTMLHAVRTMHYAPCSMHNAPCTMHHAPCTLHHAPCTDYCWKSTENALGTTWVSSFTFLHKILMNSMENGCKGSFAPCTMRHARTMHHVPCTMRHAPRTMHHAPCTMHIALVILKNHQKIFLERLGSIALQAFIKSI